MGDTASAVGFVAEATSTEWSIGEDSEALCRHRGSLK
jgi:hypothetical protein